MNRLPRLVLALLTPFVLAWSAASHAAASCTNGKTIYHQDRRASTSVCSQQLPRHQPVRTTRTTSRTASASAGDHRQRARYRHRNGRSARIRGRTSSATSRTSPYTCSTRPPAQPCPAATPNRLRQPDVRAPSATRTSARRRPRRPSRSRTPAAPRRPALTYPAAPTHSARPAPARTARSPPARAALSCSRSARRPAGAFTPTSRSRAPASACRSRSPAPASPPRAQRLGVADVARVRHGQRRHDVAAQTITVSNTGTADATNMSYPAAPAKFTSRARA